MLSIRRLRFAAQVTLAALLFAQAALAVAACDWIERSPAKAFATAETPTCHEAPATNANLCLAHCLGDDQTGGKSQPPLPAMFDAPALLSFAQHPVLPSLRVRGAPPPPEPPPRIRFQTLRI